MYYELTGQCSPCHTIGDGLDAANEVLEELDSVVTFGDVHCLQ